MQLDEFVTKQDTCTWTTAMQPVCLYRWLLAHGTSTSSDIISDKVILTAMQCKYMTESGVCTASDSLQAALRVALLSLPAASGASGIVFGFLATATQHTPA